MNKHLKFLKHFLRIALAVPLSILALKYFKFESFGNVMLFLAIYLLVSFLLEFIFKIFDKEKNV
jgi:hypothetical protein